MKNIVYIIALFTLYASKAIAQEKTSKDSIVQVVLNAPSKKAQRKADSTFFISKLRDKFRFYAEVENIIYDTTDNTIKLFFKSNLLTVIIKAEDKQKFAATPEIAYLHKMVRLDGNITKVNDHFVMVANNPSQITIYKYD